MQRISDTRGPAKVEQTHHHLRFLGALEVRAGMSSMRVAVEAMILIINIRTREGREILFSSSRSFPAYVFRTRVSPLARFSGSSTRDSRTIAGETAKLRGRSPKAREYRFNELWDVQ